MKQDDKQLILDILVKNNLLTENQKQELENKAAQEGSDILQLIEKKQIIPEEIFTKIKSKIFNIPYIDLKDKKIPTEVLEIITEDLARNYQIIAFRKVGNEVGIAMLNPQDFRAIEALEYIARKKNIKLNYFITSKGTLEKALQAYESIKNEVKEAMESAAADVEQHISEISTAEHATTDAQTAVKTAPVSKMVSVILRHAIEGKSSDVHIEPVGEETRVRYRVDGKLNTSIVLPKNVHGAIVARIKVLANLKLDETRLPQDGRFRMTLEGRTIDFRVSTMPLLDQEKVVLRILDSSSNIFDLQKLGFTGRNFEVMKEYMQKPNGMFLVTGPTGSGKSTTLYTLLSMLNKEGVNIITLEDPIEYYIPGVNQSQVRPEIGLSFASGLRSILRQDPDVIMVGEVRDNETAELAIHASLTGHIVLSTLHTNDALGAVPRLIDMKVEPFLISSALNVVIAQRLARKICEHCKQEATISKTIEKALKEEIKGIPDGLLPKELVSGDAIKFYYGKGCTRCEQSGYKGRIAIAEVLVITNSIKQMIADGGIQNTKAMQAEVIKQGMISMKVDGILKAMSGLTTIDEVYSITKD